MLRRANPTTVPVNPLLWLALFVSLSVGVTFLGGHRLFDGPRQVAARVVAPFESGVSRVGSVVSGWTSGWADVGRLRQENIALKQTVDELLQEAVRLRAAELENRELRAQLKYEQEHAGQQLQAAQVIALDTSSLVGYAVIDRGNDAGIQDGMTVLTTAGLVGRVASTTASTSRVQLINTPSSVVNAVIQGAPGATGRLKGTSDGRLIMDLIPQAEPVRLNDIVVTSGLGGAFERNVAIGRVVSLDSRDVDLFQQALVEPFVNFHQLTHVMVDVGYVPKPL